MTETLKEEFREAMIAIYTRTFSACGYRAGRFLEMVNTQGGLETAKILLREEKPPAGFVALHEKERLDVTIPSSKLNSKPAGALLCLETAMNGSSEMIVMVTPFDGEKPSKLKADGLSE